MKNDYDLSTPWKDLAVVAVIFAAVCGGIGFGVAGWCGKGPFAVEVRPIPHRVSVPCDECHGHGKVTRGDDYPAQFRGTFACPMCSGSGELWMEPKR